MSNKFKHINPYRTDNQRKITQHNHVNIFGIYSAFIFCSYWFPVVLLDVPYIYFHFCLCVSCQCEWFSFNNSITGSDLFKKSGWYWMTVVLTSIHYCSLICLHGPFFYWYGSTLIHAWINNHIHNKMWDEITYPFSNFNSTNIGSLEMD